MGTLAMSSGLGEIFMPDMEMMMMAMQMADADFDPMQQGMYGDGDHPMAPVNPSLLKAVYKSGMPYYTQKVDLDDFVTQKWDPVTFDRTLTGLANGQLIIKEVEWAKQFHVDSHFGVPTDDFGAQWRFIGSALIMEAKMQASLILFLIKPVCSSLHLLCQSVKVNLSIKESQKYISDILIYLIHPWLEENLV